MSGSLFSLFIFWADLGQASPLAELAAHWWWREARRWTCRGSRAWGTPTLTRMYMFPRRRCSSCCSCCSCPAAAIADGEDVGGDDDDDDGATTTGTGLSWAWARCRGSSGASGR